MLSDIPYRSIMDNGCKYDVWVLRDLHDKTFAAIAREYGVSVAAVISSYERVLFLKTECYVNHLSIVHGYENTAYFREIWRSALDCYCGRNYVVAYFEKEYADILANTEMVHLGCRSGFCRLCRHCAISSVYKPFPALSGLGKRKA